MLVCSWTSARYLTTVKFLCSSRRLVLPSTKRAYHSDCVSVLQRNVPFRRVINPLIAPGGLVISSGIGSDFEVKVSRRFSMSSDTMSHRMVWVDLEVTNVIAIHPAFSCVVDLTLLNGNSQTLANATSC